MSALTNSRHWMRRVYEYTPWKVQRSWFATGRFAFRRDRSGSVSPSSAIRHLVLKRRARHSALSLDHSEFLTQGRVDGREQLDSGVAVERTAAAVHHGDGVGLFSRSHVRNYHVRWLSDEYNSRDLMQASQPSRCGCGRARPGSTSLRTTILDC